LYFKLHQPVRIRKYRYYDIGKSDRYFDDYNNKMIIKKAAQNCYQPSNKIMLDLIRKYQGQFRITFSISGTMLDLLKSYSPEVIESFRELAETGCVEFVAETWSHSFSALKSKTEFRRQVENHADAIESLFGKRPTVFTNTEFIYSDEIGAWVAEMGFIATLTKNSDQNRHPINPNYNYSSSTIPSLSVLLKNDQLSVDIALRFINTGLRGWPLTSQKFVMWLNKIPKDEKIVNLVFDYETFGNNLKSDARTLKYIFSLPSKLFQKTDFGFMTPSEVLGNPEIAKPLKDLPDVNRAIEEQELTSWFGNEFQQEAFDRLYELSGMMDACRDEALLKDWQYMQTSDHFFFMGAKYFSESDIHKNVNPYSSMYEAFVNYMNVLNDFTLRLENHLKENRLNATLKNWEHLKETEHT